MPYQWVTLENPTESSDEDVRSDAVWWRNPCDRRLRVSWPRYSKVLSP